VAGDRPLQVRPAQGGEERALELGAGRCGEVGVDDAGAVEFGVRARVAVNAVRGAESE
jgi:hypothetical protein